MAVRRMELPDVGVSPVFSPPRFHCAKLVNGVRVWVVSHRRAPVLTLKLLIRAGSGDDPIGQSGVAALTADVLDEGTRHRSDVELHAALTRIGAHLSIDVSSDATVLTLTTLPKHAADAVALLVEVVTQPRLDEDDCERVRDLRLNRVLQMRQVPSAVADRVLLENLYGSHPYGHLAIGTEVSLRQLKASDVGAFHSRWYGLDNWTLVVAGDLADKELVDLVTTALDSIEGPSTLTADNKTLRNKCPSPPEHRLFFVPRKDAVQSEVRLGHLGASRTSPDYYALLVMNMVLGGQFVSRINLNLREDKGYTYGARTSFDWRVGRGLFSFGSSVQTSATVAALQEVVSEITAIRSIRPVNDKELGIARAGLTLGLPRSFETASQIARAGTSLALHDLPPDELSRFIDEVNSVDKEQLIRVAKTNLHLDQLVAVVVGSSDEVLSSLPSLGFGEPVVLD